MAKKKTPQELRADKAKKLSRKNKSKAAARPDEPVSKEAGDPTVKVLAAVDALNVTQLRDWAKRYSTEDPRDANRIIARRVEDRLAEHEASKAA
jgi:hypothetical protein